MTDRTLPLGRDTGYPTQYDPDLLFPIARSDSRKEWVADSLPFTGSDLWNAWDFTWLRTDGLPRVATAAISIPADSPNLVESKSLKLYLNAFSMSRFESRDAVEAAISRDLSATVGAQITVRVATPKDQAAQAIASLPGTCIEDAATERPPVLAADVDAALLRADAADTVTEVLHSHLLRSLCPVTDQPDIGSIVIDYQGPRIDPLSLLDYIVSYREHNDFHEACVERIFVDILERCKAEKLSVFARYQRRGGIDINPFRSNWQQAADNLRIWRQ